MNLVSSWLNIFQNFKPFSLTVLWPIRMFPFFRGVGVSLH